MSKNAPEIKGYDYLIQNSIILPLSQLFNVSSLSLKKTTLFYLLSAFLLKISLDLSSYYILAEYYAPFTLKADLNEIKLLESYVLLLIIVLAMPKKQQRLSTVIIWIFVVLSYIPMLTVYGLSNESRAWMYATSGFWLLTFILIQLHKKTLAISRYTLQNSSPVRIILALLLVAYTLASIGSSPGVSLTLDLVKIYEVRANFAPLLPFASYVIYWTSFVINPLFIVLFILRKKYLFSAIICLFQFFLFAALGQKIFLLSIPLILSTTWLIAKRKLTFASLNLILVVMILFSSISFVYLGDLWLSAILTNRLLVLPAVISFNYYDFFSENGPLYLGYSIFSSFIQYPYEVQPWFIIGKIYFSNPQNSANTGMVADAYMNFHYSGLLFLAPLFTVTLRLIDGFTKLHDYRLVLASVIMPILWSLNGSFLTSILSGGLGLAFLLFYLLPVKEASGRWKQIHPGY